MTSGAVLWKERQSFSRFRTNDTFGASCGPSEHRVIFAS
ncbi:uncharacterized protein METZ01_LOCUS459640 [marine metagenome]|uniref:Uncharacterized protein n=1 Tax=marine metagenome TaxID=408172 RepID=A0A383AFU5_9ZZZZ